MTTVFKSELFQFLDDETEPEHLDDYPSTESLDPSLHHIEGLIPEDGDFVWLAINLDGPETAERMLAAAVRRQRSDGPAELGIALVRPNFEGAYLAGENILSPGA
jgi:hypothetical protein